MPGPFRLKTLVMEDMILIPRYFIPLYDCFPDKGGVHLLRFKCVRLSGVASLFFQLLLYPKKLQVLRMLACLNIESFFGFKVVVTKERHQEIQSRKLGLQQELTSLYRH